MSSTSPSSVSPVFFKAKDLGEGFYGTVDICRAAESTTGVSGIYGCQKIAGVYRLYPSSSLARTKLVATGFPFRGHRILPSPTHPDKGFYLDGAAVQAVRLTISNLPLSVANSEIERVKSGWLHPFDPLSRGLC